MLQHYRTAISRVSVFSALMLDRKVKVLLILFTIFFSSTVLAIHSNTRIFPIGVLGLVIISLFVVLMGLVDDSISVILAITIGILSSVSIRIINFFYYPTLIGRDSNFFAVAATRVIRTGEISGITSLFYNTISGFMIWIATLNHILGIPLDQTFVVLPIAISIVALLSGYILARNLVPFSKNRAGLLAVSLVIVGPRISIYSYLSRAQSFQIITYLLAFYLLLRWVQTSDWRIGISLIIIMIHYTVSYKLPLPFVVGGIIMFIVMTNMVNRFRFAGSERSHIRIMSVLVTILMLTQIILVTNYGLDVLARLYLGSRVSATAAVDLGPDPAGILSFIPTNGIVILLTISGIGWCYLFYKDNKKHNVLMYLSVIAFTVASLAATVLSDSTPTFFRISGAVIPVLLVLIAVAFVRYRPYASRRTVIGFAILLIVLQGSMVGIAPDDPRRAQMYLTHEEVEAKEFGYNHIRSEVGTDDIFARQRLPSRFYLLSERNNNARLISPSDKFQPIYESEASMIVERNTNTYFSKESLIIFMNVSGNNCSQIYHNGGPKYYQNCNVNV